MIIAILLGCFVIYEIVCLFQYKKVREEEKRKWEPYRYKPPTKNDLEWKKAEKEMDEKVRDTMTKYY